MSRFQNLLILTVLCYTISSGFAQNYFYFHRTNHPSILQSNNYQSVIPYQTYSAPAATQTTFFSSPFFGTSNYNSRPTFDPQAFHSRSNGNIIANSATYPHAYVPIREYTPVRTNPFPAQGYYSVYNAPAAPAAAVVPTYAPPTKYQFVQKPLKPLQPLRPLAPLPQFLRLTNPVPNINFGNSLFTQSALNAQPNVFQLKQLYGIKNEHPQVTGYSYSIGNNDKVTSTITVNFGSAKPFNTLPPLLAPAAVQPIPAAVQPETESQQNITVSPSVVASEPNNPNYEDVNVAPALEVSSPVIDAETADAAAQDTKDAVDDSKLQEIDDTPKIDVDIPVSSGAADTEAVSVSNTLTSEIADAGAESSDKAQDPIPTPEIDILLQPPSVEPPPAESAAAESPAAELPAPESEISHSEDKEPEIVHSSVSADPEKDLSDALVPEQELETAKSDDDLEPEVAIEPQQELSSTSTTTTSPISEDSDGFPPDYDYFTDPATAEKEAIELRSLARKDTPGAQLLETTEKSIKEIPIETSSSESPSSTTESVDLVKSEISNEDKETAVVSNAKVVDHPATYTPIESNKSEKPSDDTDSESSRDKVESSTSVSMTSTTEILVPGAMTTISDRTIEISNRKVRVVIKRRVSRPARRTRYPVVELVLPRRF